MRVAERREVGRLERETGVEERKFKQLSIKVHNIHWIQWVDQSQKVLHQEDIP